MLPVVDGQSPPIGAPEKLYQGERGRAYFARQDQGGRHSEWNLWLWNRFVRPEDEIVEFGCGGGHLLSRLEARRKVGVEINDAAVASAHARGLEVHTTLGELPDDSFTLAISSHALEHVASPFDTLRELRRVLRASGRLVLLLPLDDWRHPRQRTFRRGDADMHLHAWTPLTLGNLLASAGFDVDRVETLSHAFPPRIGPVLWSLNESLFHAAARLSAVMLRRRQLLAVARAAAAP